MTIEDEFRSCWQHDAPRVLAYARRHVGPDSAQDVVAETFLAAWRRWDDVPTPALPWLIGTARRQLANQRRAGRRRDALALRLRLLDGAASRSPDAAVTAAERGEALAGLAALPENQREALLLIAWDGLSPADAAAVLGVRPATLRVRLHRARRALETTPEPAPNRGAPLPAPQQGGAR